LYQHIQKLVEAQALAPTPVEAAAVDRGGHVSPVPVEATVAATVAPPLPEAPASVNCHILIEGRQVQVTLRDTDEVRLLERLAAVLRQSPDFPPSAGKKGMKSSGETSDKGWCAIHNCAMKLNEKDGRTWYSHRSPDGNGWCKGRARR
jgi:hypothetical protein